MIRILVPWAMPEIGREVLKKSKAEIIFLHGPKGELPTHKDQGGKNRRCRVGCL
jgi:hypothetical protein